MSTKGNQGEISRIVNDLHEVTDNPPSLLNSILLTNEGNANNVPFLRMDQLSLLFSALSSIIL